MKRILVPTDFSVPAENALKLANSFMTQNAGEIILLHIIEPIKSYISAIDGMYITPSLEQDYIQQLVENAKLKLEETAEIYTSTQINVIKAVEVGSIFNIVKDYIKSTESDMVIMGTQGVSGLDEILIGSNTEKVVRTATCPILTIRDFPDDFDIKNIVFASSLKKDNMKIIPKLKQIQTLLNNAKLHILFVNVASDFHTNREIEHKQKAFFEAASLENYDFHIYNARNEENGILHFAEDNGMDLIAVASHQRTGLAHLIGGSISEDVVNHSKIPVLTFGIKNMSKK